MVDSFNEEIAIINKKKLSKAFLMFKNKYVSKV